MGLPPEGVDDLTGVVSAAAFFPPDYSVVTRPLWPHPPHSNDSSRIVQHHARFSPASLGDPAPKPLNYELIRELPANSSLELALRYGVFYIPSSTIIIQE